MTNAVRNALASDGGEAASARSTGVSSARGAIAGRSAQSGWHQLYGSFFNLGVSIESHDFQMADPFEWSRGFHSDSVELCLNLTGHGSVCFEGREVTFEPLTAGFYLPGKQALHALRQAGQRHRFVTLGFSARYLREHLAGCDGALHPLIEHFIRDGSRAGLGDIHRLPSEQERLVAHLLQPPVFQGARGLWYRSKVLQLMVDFFFERQGDGELFCDRQKRLARERVDRVIAVLRRCLSEPPGLEELGREVGCSPFYLSRTFSRETGMTIPQCLRKLRMERAAELLRSGKYNVTEAAFEVGYSSLSHFSQAFCQTMGCCPGLYPLKRATQADAAGGATPAGPDRPAPLAVSS